MKLTATEARHIENWQQENKLTDHALAKLVGVKSHTIHRWLACGAITPESRKRFYGAIAKFNADKEPHFGQKNDQGKPLAGTIPQYFPRVLLEIAKVSTMGAQKYTRGGWVTVPDGETRYWDGAFRHILASQIEASDTESGLNHLDHAIWNLMAVRELQLRNKEPK